MKKLKLHRETVSILSSSALDHVHGGGTIVAIPNTRFCPVPIFTHGCTGGSCVETITSGTSVINPSGG
jgi:hypothetical protein